MLIFVTIVAGLLIGSFLTVVVDRVPRGESIVAPPARLAVRCGLAPRPARSGPVFSWLALRGKCRRCRAPIGIEPLVLELATAGMFVLFALKFEDTAPLPAYCVLGAGWSRSAGSTCARKRLPREIIYVTARARRHRCCASPRSSIDEPRRIWMMAARRGDRARLHGLVYVASRGGMGDGDVRLSPLLGVYLGWLNPGFVLRRAVPRLPAGAVVGVAMMAGGKAGRKTAVPFGPFLALGTVVAILLRTAFRSTSSSHR